MSSGTKRKAPSPPAGGDEDEPLPGKLGADLLRGLRDADACDITLVGSDGGTVPAFRTILALRSKVFGRMLLGDFKEGRSDEIRLEYHSTILKDVVEYCCSDGIARFDAYFKSDTTKPEEDIATLRDMVTVAAASHFFGLKGLYSYVVEDMLGTIIRQDTRRPGANRDARCFDICTIWDESLKQASLHELQSLALDAIEDNTFHTLVRDVGGFSGVAVLSPDALLRLVQDDRLVVHANDLLSAVHEWSETEIHGLGREERMEIARNCASKIDIRFASARNALQLVESDGSGLLDSDRAVKALKDRAENEFIWVYGAGTSCVNGIYRESEYLVNGEHFVYEKDATLDGEAIKFFVYNRRGRWHLSAPRVGGQEVLATDDDRAFYKSEKDPANDPLSPYVHHTLSWKTAGLGIEPAPKAQMTRQLSRLE
eukprot:CAMPEP_0178553758 /NCGR_PEP_ID=MMETSP0697-20121206/7981_1 /TAXON_ID=265572 /ORGANISM="Extubocellulus spinifer, Strain CCMP396" /LENGTH=426 /DNA_ID=CAMNT_0020186683 /DNA_START=60 /DNA_END=1340 /DNA_ORIENTATION=-